MLSKLNKSDWRVSTKWLLSLYLLLPIGLTFVLVDMLVFDSALRDLHLPEFPATWAVWAILFNTPHILASIILMADPSYLEFHKKRLMGPSVVIVVGVLVTPIIFGYTVFHVGFALYTMLHVLSQQFGIAAMLLRAHQCVSYQIVRWTAVLASSIVYFFLFSGNDWGSFKIINIPLTVLGACAAALLLATMTVFAVFTYKKSAPGKIASYFFWSNVLMVWLSLLFWLMDYSIVTIMVPRAVHDLTAFSVYAVHDQNRNVDKPKNWFYQSLAFTRLPPLLLCPLLSVGLAYLLLRGDSYWVVTTNYILAVLHYYIESFAWKKNSVNRLSVRFC